MRLVWRAPGPAPFAARELPLRYGDGGVGLFPVSIFPESIDATLGMGGDGTRRLRVEDSVMAV